MIEQLLPGFVIPVDANYVQQVQKRKFWCLSYEGGPEYTCGTDAQGGPILKQFRRENRGSYKKTQGSGGKNLNYEERRSRAVLNNYLKQTIDSFVDYVFKEKITRVDTDPKYQAYIRNFNGYGDNVTIVMKDLLRNALIYGSYYILAESLSESPVYNAEQAEKIKFCLETYHPDNVIWECTTNNIVDAAIVKTSKTEGFYVDTNVIIDITLADTKVLTVSEPYVHNFGICPLVKICVNSPTPNLAEQQKKIFNLNSLTDEEYFSATFSQTCIVGIDKSELTDGDDVDLGADRILGIPSNKSGGNPDIKTIGADVAQADSLRQAIEKEIKEFYRVAGLKSADPTGTGQAESGIAKAFNHFNVTGQLAGYAQATERAENLFTDCWAIATGSTRPQATLYPTEYGVATKEDAAKEVKDFLGMNVPAILKKLQLMNYAQQFVSMNAKQKSIFEKQLDALFPDQAVGTTEDDLVQTEATVIDAQKKLPGPSGTQY